MVWTHQCSINVLMDLLSMVLLFGALESCTLRHGLYVCMEDDTDGCASVQRQWHTPAGVMDEFDPVFVLLGIKGLAEAQEWIIQLNVQITSSLSCCSIVFQVSF